MNITNIGNLCSGCSACYNICPINAISMQENDEGFLYPVIDEDKCTNCGLCAKNCPAINPIYKNNKKPKCFAVMANDEIRYNSSSGGVFPVLAHYFLDKGNYVAGAVWNKDGSVKHIVSNKKEDIEAMRGSKYLQSSIGDCYREIKNILNLDKKVLFTGTPCQVAGLYAYLKKEYENLYTVEIICHGTPSPKVFKKYLDETLAVNESFINTSFRNKINGWSHKHIVTTETNLRTFDTPIKEHPFSQAFLKDLCLRNSCGECRFNRIPRQADITTGDFWGVWKFNKKLDDTKGTSIIFVNSKKGKYIFSKLKKEFKLVKPVPFKMAIKGNPNMVKPTKPHSKRKDFMELINKHTLKDSLDYCLDNKADCMILNYWYAINYGAALTCYGVQCLTEKFGLNTKIINYKPAFKKDYPNSFSEKFANKYFNLTAPINCYEDFLALNNSCKTFIVGSDQVWSPKHIETHCDNAIQSIYLLDFVKNGNKKLSYSASFGISDFQGDYEQEILFKHFIKQFDAISVREDDGINILKELGINEATHLLDGAFLIPKEKLNEMTKEFVSNEKYIACFVLPYFKKQKWYKNLVLKISEKLNLPVKYFDFNKTTPVEQWLAFIKNSEFVVTDSFHGFAFSLIFNRPFVQVKNAKAQSRFESMFRLLNIEDNSVSKEDKINFEKIFIKRDWEQINKKIEEEVLKAEQWMKNALENPVKDNSRYEFENFLLINSQLKTEETKRNLKLIKNYKKVLFDYNLTKFLKIFSKGKRKKELKEKIQNYKKQIKKIKL